MYINKIKDIKNMKQVISKNKYILIQIQHLNLKYTINFSKNFQKAENRATMKIDNSFINEYFDKAFS